MNLSDHFRAYAVGIALMFLIGSFFVRQHAGFGLGFGCGSIITSVIWMSVAKWIQQEDTP